MASSVYDDDSNHSSISTDSDDSDDLMIYTQAAATESATPTNENETEMNLVVKLANRQMYGRVAKTWKSKTEPMFKDVHRNCKIPFGDIVFNKRSCSHFYMGFTICGQYFISYKEIMVDVVTLFPCIEYILYIWKFMQGDKLQFISKHRIFRLMRDVELDKIMFIQSPTDPYKMFCYGLRATNPGIAYLTILTLPVQEKHCRNCKGSLQPNDDKLYRGWCLNHGFMLHYMFTLSNPMPKFEPNISFAYPDHVVINTGHYIHILNTSVYKPNPQPPLVPVPVEQLIGEHKNYGENAFVEMDTMENYSGNSVVDAIIEDFSEYDLEGADGSKPFHELNISCEPLNVTGKSYHNTLVQNIKRLQGKDILFPMPQSLSNQKTNDKAKLDRKQAEKAYEFIEENEKCEKLSSFRKKRLADKKYEFSEDNSENIVPFNSLRHERSKCVYKPKSIRNPEFGLFLSPCSAYPNQTQQPTSINVSTLCALTGWSPQSSRSPISPKESARKFNVYSSSIDSDCSDNDSKLVLRQINNVPHSYSYDQKSHPIGLLIVDSKKDDHAKWIKKVVRRYSSADFENSSLVSGQSRDDYNIPIEIPILVQTLTEQHLDVVSEFKCDQVTETQLIITQRSFDCEQFVQIRAQRLCIEHQLEFLHCEDYDIKLVHICPLDGHIICQAVIKIAALNLVSTNLKPQIFVTYCLFVWNIVTDSFELVEPSDVTNRLHTNTAHPPPVLKTRIPLLNCKSIQVLDINTSSSKLSLRDYSNHYEVVMDKNPIQCRYYLPFTHFVGPYDSDSESM
ncbi:PREDICTED: uncharacterized protein LOC108556562 [Nicrophorus vespilloides]|uniref:Uncharacterized protein LOC108556562 n=1 Tax=Nicrophorus vespilloides TaxID=110193 RepID=A0ABM1M0X4_NICVS|nr:PREDICTED: uncharacterized protein LOC108556562 [Nicrophorus vespilloides]